MSYRSFSAVALVSLSLSLAIAFGGCTSPGGSGGVLPTNTDVVVRVDMTQGKAGAYYTVRKQLRKLPAYALVEDKIPTQNKILNRLAEKTNGKKLVWGKDVRPWLGKEAGAGIWLSGKWTDGNPLRGVVWIDAKDEGKAEELLKVISKKKTSEFEGVTIYHNDQDLKGVNAVYSGKLVMAERMGDLKDSIKASKGKSLEESDAFSSLDEEITAHGRKPLLSAMVVPHTWSDALSGLTYVKLLMSKTLKDDDAADKKTQILLMKTLETYDDMLSKAKKNKAGITFAVGGASKSLWVDGGFSLESNAKIPKSDALEQAKLLPEKTLGAALSDHETSKYLNDLSNKALDATADEGYLAELMMTEGSEKLPAQQKNLLSLIFKVMGDKDLLSSFEKMYGGKSLGASGLIEQDGQLAFVGKHRLQDKAAARTVGTKLMLLAGDLAGLAPGLKVEMAPLKSNSVTGMSPLKVVTLSGIPIKELLKSSLDGPDAKAMLATPLAQEFLQPELQFDAHITGDDLVTAFPAWAGTIADDPGAETLDGNSNFKRDLKAAGVPDNVSMLGWFDTAMFTQTVVDQFNKKAAAFAKGQLDHAGNVVVWSKTEKSGDRRVSRFTVAFPFYD